MDLIFLSGFYDILFNTFYWTVLLGKWGVDKLMVGRVLGRISNLGQNVVSWWEVAKILCCQLWHKTIPVLFVAKQKFYGTSIPWKCTRKSWNLWICSERAGIVDLKMQQSDMGVL